MVVVDARTYEVLVEPIAIPKAHWRMRLFKWLGRVRNRLAFGKRESESQTRDRWMREGGRRRKTE